VDSAMMGKEFLATDKNQMHTDKKLNERKKPMLWFLIWVNLIFICG
jgi:uncharacterized membrane protein